MKKVKSILYIVLCLSFCLVALCSNSSEPEPCDDNSLANLPTESAVAETTEKVDDTTEVVTEVPEEVSDEWKTAYLNLIKSKKDENSSYALVYIDSDSIPELYTSGICEAAGDAVYSYKNGGIYEQLLNRIGGGSYIEREGRVYNQNGNMGCYYTNVYKLTSNGFEEIFSGAFYERVEDLGDNNYDFSYDYYIGDELVSESEYYSAAASVFDSSCSLSLYSDTVSYDEIVRQIENY